MNKIDDFLLKAKVDLDKRTEELDTIDSVAIVAIASRITSAQAIAHNTATAVNFNNTENDTRTAVTTSPNWRFVAPVGGYYDVSCHIRLGLFSTDWAVAEYAQLSVYINGTRKRDIDTFANGISGGAAALSGSTKVYVTAGQYIEIYVFQNSGVSQNVEVGSEISWVSIAKIHGKT